MSTFTRSIYLGVMAGLLMSIVGCAHDGDRYRYDNGYRYQNGDRIDPDGHREVHWCDTHQDDPHCHR